MSQLQQGQIIRLEIRGLGSSGEGVGNLDGFTVFVDGALPEEIVEARVVECKARYAKAELSQIVKPSKDRVQPICPLFGTCGGCQIMHLSYEKQLEIKRQKVVDALSRIGQLEDCKVLPCIGSPKPLHYRNKIQLPVQGEIIGLYARRSHDLVEVKHCFIHASLGEEVYQALRPLVVQAKEIQLRHLMLKTAVHTGQVLVILITAEKPDAPLLKLAQEMKRAHPAIKGVVHNLHQGKENVILGKSFTPLAGKEAIEEMICGLHFKVSSASFFQVNPEQAEQLYQKALELCDLQGSETVLDAYSGVGTLSLIFAQKAKRMIGVECVEAAVEDAKENAKRNGIKNASFICMPSEKYIQTAPPFEIALVNPPRKGCDPLFLETLIQKAPEKILYISCDPATLARDLVILRKGGYLLGDVQPFDMFPQTAHVESVVIVRKN